MKRQYRRRYNKEDDLWGLIGGVGGLYIFYLLMQWFANRANFWRWVLYGLGVVAILIAGIFAWYKIKEEARRRKIDHIISVIRQAGLEEHINNFILRWGHGQEKSKDALELRGYSIDRSRIRDLQDFLSQKKVKFSLSDIEILLTYYVDKRERDDTFNRINATTGSFSKLSGSDFERLLYRLYEAMGYSVHLSGRVGDQGGDLIATKNQEMILVQAKCYTNSLVGNSAVQEAVAAKNHYDCNKAVVVATSNFTKEAIELARTNNVELIPRRMIQKMLLDYLHESWD